MKVKELMTELLKQDSESEMMFLMQSGCCGDHEELVLRSTENNPYGFCFYFDALPGYQSCRQASDSRSLASKK